MILYEFLLYLPTHFDFSAMLSSKQTAIESRFGLVVVLSAFWCKTLEILTGSIQLHTTFLNGDIGDTYFRDNGLFAKDIEIFSFVL